ncbi:hypothetical protein NOMA109596_10320 [Nocardioides marinus]|jgi:hypothetical protein|uniref:Uncharacterized protein n=1 Tax=Nocardioides marinus TaxID=374514 RepID=A0A7Z0C3I0_9ACTN|nr:hypothetical protein [Nocardioides marinus]NYI09114.1 hypothetical protein [Nocardioides marinus]
MAENSDVTSAVGSPVVAMLRTQVPAFEATFQVHLVEEENELGAFQAVSVFAAWLANRLTESPEAADVRRGFRVVEDVAVGDYPLGHELVTEFVEALADYPQAVERMGPETRLRLT